MSRLRVVWALAAVSCALFVAHEAGADVKLPALIGSNMVLQQGMPARVWGTAEPGERVVVRIRNQEKAATAGEKGAWQVMLDPLGAGGPFEMTIQGKNRITLRNVMAGEVWVCSGQSNMYWPAGFSANAQQEVAEATWPQVRLFSVQAKPERDPQRETQGQWVECSPKTVGGFSGVAYFFGRQLHKALGVPVGLIHSSVGGTAAEAWTSMVGLTSDPDFKEIVARWSSAPAKPDWQTPTQLYNGMIAPLTQYGIRGAIWYQGESNAGRAYQYRKLFPAMITDWRRAWRQGDFPFLFVQLANFTDLQKDPSAPSDWAELREAQLMTLALPHTAMAVAMDIGEANDIHPKNKQEVGWRLTQAALGTVYGRKVPYSGPIYESMAVEGGKIRLRFKHTDGGLKADFFGKLRGFAIAGADKQFAWAEAKIDGDTVLAWSDKVPSPVAVRYAWANNLACTLYNGAGLPASPFRTDNWPGVTADRR
jgi:sialate O-acetylesterase